MFRKMTFKTVLLTPLFLVCSLSYSQDLQFIKSKDAYQVYIGKNNSTYLESPSEGLWSIGTKWEDDWVTGWQHARATSMERHGEWTVLKGELSLPQGDWFLQDAYRQENGRVECIPRYEWNGKETLDSVTLSIRWKVPAQKAQAFLPGILYYGNPSGEKSGARKVAVYHGKPGEKALFEEHRYPMPF
jgi:hypothetical protein